MSTVQTILDIIQFRTDNKAALYPLINLAIGIIAKRLFILESDIITASLSQDLWAANTLTATTIAFAENTPSADSITDSGSAFVTSGFEAGQQITTTSTTNPGPFKIDVAAAGTLTLISTDDVTAEGAGSSITITSDASFAFLPTDFWGLKDKPYLEDYTWPLEPLPSLNTEIQYQTAGLPLYYKVKGNSKLYVYPPAGADYTVKGDYFQRPTAISADTDTMPFDELFDYVIAEIILRFFKDGAIKNTEGHQLLNAFLTQEVDLIVGKRQRSIPVAMPEGINYNQYLE